MGNNNIIFRYPGAQPFSKEDVKLFYGRDKDIKQLFNLINLEQQIVLYGKSGLGKTSLLNAGVIPKLEEDDYSVINVRFGACTSDLEFSPSDILRQKISKNIDYTNFLWDKIFGFSPQNLQQPTELQLNALENLWYYCKSVQIKQPGTKAILIVFDQFEELFTYPKDQVEKFKLDFANLQNIKIPKYIRDLFKEKGRDFLEQEESQLLYKPLSIKVLFSIRADKISFLNRIRDYFPEILKKTYELEPLTADLARHAIINPASIDDNIYKSTKFSYHQSALDSILQTLTKNNQQKIEAFHLQIICEYCERLIIKNSTKAKQSILAEDLGSVGDIFKNYYDRQILKLSEEYQTTAQVFLEEGLIFEDDKRRISIDEGKAIETYNIKKEVLRELEDYRLIRTEPSASGSITYELSHDMLVAPILTAKERRLKSKKQKEEERTRYAREKLKQNKIKRNALIVSSILIAIIVFLSVIILVVNHQRKNQITQKQKIIRQKSDLSITKNPIEKPFEELRNIITNETISFPRKRRGETNALNVRGNCSGATGKNKPVNRPDSPYVFSA